MAPLRAAGESALLAYRGRVLGVAAGTWPAIAAMRGEFSPGPFTSPYWTLIALSIGLWFLLLGTVLPGLGEHQRDGKRGERVSR